MHFIFPMFMFEKTTNKVIFIAFFLSHVFSSDSESSDYQVCPRKKKHKKKRTREVILILHFFCPMLDVKF